MIRRESDALAQRLAEADTRANDEKSRADRETKLREQVRVEGDAALRKAIADLTAKHDAALAEAKEHADAAAKRFEALQTAVTSERARADRQAGGYAQSIAERQKQIDATAKLNEAAAAQIRALQKELDRTLASLNAEHARADREVQLRQQLEAAARETLNRTAVVSSAHQRDAEEARQAGRQAEERIRELQRQLEQETLRVTFESAARQKAVDDAASLRKDLDTARAEHENALAAAEGELHAVTQLAEQQQRTIDEQRARFESEREELRAALNADFDGKLQKIVANLTTDHEHAIGDAMVEREAAKAELRLLTKKSEELQSRVDEERQRADSETAARERLDTEWNAKLEKIVAHLTEDHETDVGEAMLQREAARAEVRNLTAKVAALQKQIEDDREKFRQFALKRTITNAPTVEQKIPTAPLSRPHVVLVVHSDAGVRAMAKHTLQQAGYVVLTAADGLEGLRTASQQKPEVVLTESVMPKMNARELVQLLKSKRETAAVKIILVATDGDVGRATDFTPDEVVRNPADFNEVRAALSTVLARGVTS